MKDEYDFSGGVRGKFSREGAHLRLPIHLDPEVQLKLAKIAEVKGVTLDDLVNRLLQNEISLMEQAA